MDKDNITKELEDNFNSIQEIKKDAIQYELGPQMKSKATFLLEDVIKKILNGEAEIIWGADAKLIVEVDQESINLSGLIKNANFNHLKFDKEDLKNYEKSHPSVMKKTKNDFDESILKTNDPDQQNLLSLTHGEQLAIYSYSSYNYQNINGLLRDPDNFKGSIEQAKQALLDAAIGAVALNKVPDVDLPIVVRKQDEYALKQNITNAKNNIITQEKGFISTSFVPQHAFDEGVTIIYKDIRGKSIGALSQYPSEKEYLIPPSTQLKWTGHEKSVLGQHTFTCTGSNVLMDKQCNPPEILFNDSKLSKEDQQIFNRIADDYKNIGEISDLKKNYLQSNKAKRILNKVFGIYNESTTAYKIVSEYKELENKEKQAISKSPTNIDQESTNLSAKAEEVIKGTIQKEGKKVQSNSTSDVNTDQKITSPSAKAGKLVQSMMSQAGGENQVDEKLLNITKQSKGLRGL